jgi:hypothetical protein
MIGAKTGTGSPVGGGTPPCPGGIGATAVRRGGLSAASPIIYTASGVAILLISNLAAIAFSLGLGADVHDASNVDERVLRFLPKDRPQHRCLDRTS